MAFALRHTSLRIQAERVWLDALLSHAPDVRGLIIHASPFLHQLADSRENLAAAQLREAGFGSLLVSLLTPYEETRDPDVRYDASLLTNRLVSLLGWIRQQPQLTGLPLGLIAAGTAAGAAVRLLSRDPDCVSVLCIRAGRPDLAGAEPLRRLRLPVLLQLPGNEPDLRTPNEQAWALIPEPRRWIEIPDASASFIEPGTLDQAARSTCEWMLEHMPEKQEPAPPAPQEAPSQ
ncbi:MAG: alpha/beta hydrolase [Rhodocyclaceae bacterium]